MKGCILLHNWYHGQYITGYTSKFTDDHIGRSERRCMDCNKMQISLSQFSKEHQNFLRRKFDIPKNQKYVTYVSGDEIDILTKKIACETHSK